MPGLGDRLVRGAPTAAAPRARAVLGRPVPRTSFRFRAEWYDIHENTKMSIKKKSEKDAPPKAVFGQVRLEIALTPGALRQSAAAVCCCFPRD